MLNLFRVRLSNEKIHQKKSSRELTADLVTKPAVVRAFRIFRLEFGGNLQ